ncbi:MAG: radical SAM protein, partial [Candidatus Muiribacteriaceae bacterium]
EVFISAFSSIDMNREEDFELLRKAGIRSLFFGVESLDDDNLKRMQKGTRYKDIKDTIRRAHEAGIFTVGSFIFPIPGETEKSMNTTLERIREMKGIMDSVLILPGGIFPETDWGRNPEKYDIRLDKDYLHRMTIYPIKYLVPMRQWPDFPFSYRLMDKRASDVGFKDIIDANERFTEKVRKDIGIPGVPDYYFTIANSIKEDISDFTDKVVQSMINRDYSTFSEMRKKMI